MKVTLELAHNLLNTVAGLEERLSAEAAAHLQTIGLLRSLVAGEIPLEAVEVTERGWKLKNPEEVLSEARGD